MKTDRADFLKLMEQEPALLELMKRVRALRRAARGRTDVCANRLWYEHIKPPLTRLVGWSAVNESLRTHGAYDTAYQYLYELMPECRNCGCMRLTIRVKPSRTAQLLSSQIGGPYVHFLKAGRIEKQGLIVDTAPGVVQVLYFEWLMGEPSENHWYPLEEIQSQQCRLYRNADVWRAAYDIESSRRSA